ncbi:hypothetical protein FA15DRAFT_756616 [Coprinopsis marcescibilis]|uniref:DUF6534 domain-containing protein n=1 Tax=Coprinopsis marcescibilis TaxID=230819 RepID=A0A5C3L7W6_COPMA|nr:hypothetical protein FA15DRAFT_756616 [Coprinopsis marcescibilis]
MNNGGPSSIDSVFQLGPTLIGSQLAFFLFGAFIVQLYHYITNPSGTEKYYTKILVTFITVAELLSILIICDHAWHALIRNKAIHENHILSVTAPFYTILNGSLGVCFQWLFSWRIYSLRSNGFDFAVAVAAAVFSMAGNDLSKVHKLGIPVGVYLISGLICDLSISIAMICQFHRYRQWTQLRATKVVLTTLIVHTIESGMVVTFLALANVVLFYTRPHDSIHIAIHWSLGRIYANVILATLNNRHHLRKINQAPDHSLSLQTSIRFTPVDNHHPFTNTGVSKSRSHVIHLDSGMKEEEQLPESVLRKYAAQTHTGSLSNNVRLGDQEDGDTRHPSQAHLVSSR